MARRKTLLREAAWAIATSLIATLIAWHALGFSFIRMDVPIVYTGDAIQYAYIYQANREDGWNAPISRAGAPFGTSNYDFPNADGLNLALTRALAVVADDPFTIFNLYVLATFVLCGLLAYAVFRRLGLSALWAAVASLVFNLLPFHFQRVVHLFYLMYATAALAGWLALDVVYEGTANSCMKRALAVCAALICGATGIYYAFFSCIVISIAALCAAAASAGVRPLLRGSFLIALVVASTAANIAPSWWHVQQHGRNPEVAAREPQESEIVGLKLTQLVLPRLEYRIPYVAQVRAAYEQSSPLSNENKTASLGLIGTLGFLLLLVVPFLGRYAARLPSVLQRASAPTYAAFLYATIGGFGSLFALLVSPQLRALNRISPFIAFFGTLAFVAFASAFSSRWRMRRVSALLALSLVGVCVFDQVAAGGPRWAPYYAEVTRQFDQERLFFQQLEQKLPAGSMLAQFPLMSYPEAHQQANLGAYDLSAAYLHTKTLRWTFGAMHGRPEGLWQRQFDAFAPARQIAAMKALGFAGVVVDRRGYVDRAAMLDAQFASSGLVRSTSKDTIREFYPLPQSATAENRAFAVAPSRGWFGIKAQGATVVASSSGDASLLIGNVAASRQQCHLELTLESAEVARRISVWAGATKLAEHSLPAGEPKGIAFDVDLADGAREIVLRTDPPAVSIGAKPATAFDWIAGDVPLCR